MTNWKKKAILVMTMGMAATALAGCGTEARPIGRDTTEPTIQVMTMAQKASPADQTSPVLQEAQKILGEKMSEKYGKQYDKINLDIQWVASTAYDEKVTAAMGANEYPHVMLVSTRNSSVIQNSKAGTFWDISDVFDKTDPKYVTEENPEGYVYPHLHNANPTINRNISVDGKIYGLYRARTIGRQGVTIRKDWLDNLGLSQPTTIDEFENVLRAFTEDDPDGNGQNDTYGMIVTTYLDGPLNNLAIWEGSPNEWGYDEETGEWKPWFMSEGYFEAMCDMRDWYAAGYINTNMATLDSNSWDNDFLNGVGGVQIDVADRARRNATNIVKNFPDAEVDVFGYVKKDANAEPAVWPTTGYNGYYVFPVQTTPDTEDLDFILSVLDACNATELTDMFNNGLEGRHYTIDDEGYIVKKVEGDPDENGVPLDEATLNSLTNEYADLNQFSMGLDSTQGSNTRFANKTAEKVEEVYDDNENWSVSNPMAPYTSDTYSISGTQLDAIIAEAKTNFIVGKIDEEGWKEAIEQWVKMDGDLVCKDYQDAYEADESNHDENGNIIIPDEYKFDFRFGF